MKWQRDRHDLIKAYRSLKAGLEASCRSFDDGNHWEAMRIASAIDILAHDRGRRTVSCLTQLGLRGKLRIPSSRTNWDEDNLCTLHPLTMIRIDSQKAAYVARLDNRPDQQEYPLQQFVRWWEEPVIRDAQRRYLSRKNIVVSMRDQDGGGHLDGSLTDEAYISVSRLGGGGWMFGLEGKQGEPIPDLHLATMRQIGWEFVEGLGSIEFLVDELSSGVAQPT